MIEETKQGVRIHLLVQPNSNKNEIIGPHNGALKIKIKAPPVDGKANEEIISFFSKLLKIPKRDIDFVRGTSGKTKVLGISGISKLQIEKILQQGSE